MSLKKDYSLSSVGTFEIEIREEIISAKCNDLEDLVHGFQLTYDENIDIIHLEFITGSPEKYTLPPGINEIVDNNFMLKSLLPKEVEVIFTFDDVRLKSNLTTKKTIRFTKKSFVIQY